MYYVFMRKEALVAEKQLSDTGHAKGRVHSPDIKENVKMSQGIRQFPRPATRLCQ